jgi:hypothetical protein
MWQQVTRLELLVVAWVVQQQGQVTQQLVLLQSTQGWALLRLLV